MNNLSDIQRKNRLSIKLLKAVLFGAFVLGVVLSLIQVFIDAQQSSTALDQKAEEMMLMIQEPATRAAKLQDSNMGKEVLNGLLSIKSVQVAAIRLDGDAQFAMVEREFFNSRYRIVSDYIFDPIRVYKKDLLHNDAESKFLGEILIAIDTAHEGKAFIQRSVVVMITGVIRAIAMALLLHFIHSTLLTKPLNKLIDHLSNIDPEDPEQQTLPTPKGNEDNELGLWVKTANNLLHSINKHQALRQKAEAQIMRLSQYDYLTRLPNRHTIQAHLEKLINKGSQRQIAILCLGIDDFKSLNAQVNFNAAEYVLVSLADRLRSFLGSRAYIGRLGEDQFTIIQNNITQPYEAAELAQILLKQLTQPFHINDETLTISATVGITLYPNDGNSVDSLLQQSEFAMIMAKSRSRNRYQFYIANIDTEIRNRKRLEMDLHQALENNELSLLYQPQYCFEQQTLIGVEALLRWHHPEHGNIPPETFIPMAEHNLDIIPIGDWVLEHACQQLQQWHESGYHTARMAINLSAIQLQDDRLVERIAFLMQKYKVDPATLEIEVTETSIMDDIELAKRQLNNIKALGVIVTLDDFGTGYSSLSYLKQLPFDKLKIDKSFIEGIPDNQENMVIIDAIIQLGRSFKLKVLAEGVETEAQAQYLADNGCQEGQGYLYGKPLEADEVIIGFTHTPPTQDEDNEPT